MTSFCAPQAAIVNAYSRRAISDLDGKTTMECFIEAELTKETDIDFNSNADLDTLFCSSGATGIPASFWDPARPVSTRTGASHPFAVFNLKEVSTKRGTLSLISLRPDIMEAILRRVIAEKAPDVGGFTDLEAILDTPRLKPDGKRILFALAFQRWWAGNGSVTARMDIPDRAQVDPVAPYDSFVEMFLESLKRASPRLFVPGAPTPVPAAVTATAVLASPTKAVSALSLQFQNKYLASSDQRHFNSEEFHDCVSTGLDVIRRYVDLENFLTVTLEALKLFRPVVREASIEPDNSLLDFLDAIKRIEARGEVQPYEILTEISENIPTLKRQADKAYRLVKAAFKRASDTLDAEKVAKRQAQGSKSNVDPAVMEMMRESFQVYHQLQSNSRNNNNNRNNNRNRQSTPLGTQNQHRQNQVAPYQQQVNQQQPPLRQQQPAYQPRGGTNQQRNQQGRGPPGPPTDASMRHKSQVNEAITLLQAKFTSASREQLYTTVRGLIMQDRQCLGCRGDMHNGPNNRLACVANCTRSTLHPANKAKIQACDKLK